MGVSGVGGGVLSTHPFVDPREMDAPKPAVGANAGSAFTRPDTQASVTQFVSPMAVPPPKDLGRVVDLKM